MSISSTNTENVTDTSLLLPELTGGCLKCIMNFKKQLNTTQTFQILKIFASG